MKFLFIIQGEGRGHATQAMALYEILNKHNHDVCAAMLGTSRLRQRNSFIENSIKCPVLTFKSPNFLKKKNKKGILVFRSIVYNFFYTFQYIASIRKINKTVKTSKPDVIVNFYDMIGGLYAFFYNPKIRVYCISHQYYFNHPDFVPPKGFFLQKKLLALHSRITSLRATKILALSYTDGTDIPKKRLYLCPPLIRNEILTANNHKNGFVLGYILNEGFSQDIIKWHEQHPATKLHVFWDKAGIPEETVINNNLVFHKINNEKFVRYLEKCSSYFSTAGFESICEAMFLGKPVLVNPSERHYEQNCNAVDAVNTGAAITNNQFNLSSLIEFSENYRKDHYFEKWVKQAESVFLYHLGPE